MTQLPCLRAPSCRHKISQMVRFYCHHIIDQNNAEFATCYAILVSKQRSVVFIVAIRYLLEFQQRMWTSAVHANRDNSGTQDTCTLVLNLSRTAYKGACNHTPKRALTICTWPTFIHESKHLLCRFEYSLNWRINWAHRFVAWRAAADNFHIHVNTNPHPTTRRVIPAKYKQPLTAQSKVTLSH